MAIKTKVETVEMDASKFPIGSEVNYVLPQPFISETVRLTTPAGTLTLPVRAGESVNDSYISARFKNYDCGYNLYITLKSAAPTTEFILKIEFDVPDDMHGFYDDKSKGDVYSKEEIDVRFSYGSNLGSKIDLKAFSGSSMSVVYTFPSDGYFFFSRIGATGSEAIVSIHGAKENPTSHSNGIRLASVSSGTPSDDVRSALYVRKGMKAYMTAFANSDANRNALSFEFWRLED